MKESCPIWEEAVTLAQERGVTLGPTCPIEAFCEEGCLMSVKPNEAQRRLKIVHERARHYSDVPAHKERSVANRK